MNLEQLKNMRVTMEAAAVPVVNAGVSTIVPKLGAGLKEVKLLACEDVHYNTGVSLVFTVVDEEVVKEFSIWQPTLQENEVSDYRKRNSINASHANFTNLYFQLGLATALEPVMPYIGPDERNLVKAAAKDTPTILVLGIDKVTEAGEIFTNYSFIIKDIMAIHTLLEQGYEFSEAVLKFKEMTSRR